MRPEAGFHMLNANMGIGAERLHGDRHREQMRHQGGALLQRSTENSF